MKAFVPQKAAREEGPRGNAGEEFVRPFELLLIPRARLGCLLPKAFIFFFVLDCIRPVDNGVAIEIPDAAEKVRKEGARELLIVRLGKRTLRLEYLSEALRKGRGRVIDSPCKSCG
jgi:hypothetical protein